MKHPTILLATLLLLAVAGNASAQVTAPARTSLPAIFAEPPSGPPPASGGLLGSLIALLKPRIDRPSTVERDKETWSRLSRVGIPDKSAESEYMLKGILMTAVLSAGVVGWRLVDPSPRGPRVAVKACRAGAMIGIQGEF